MRARPFARRERKAVPPAAAARFPTAGEWLGLADRVEALMADLCGTDLEHWRGSLRFLVADIREEAGVEVVHEVAGDGRHGHVESRRAA